MFVSKLVLPALCFISLWAAATAPASAQPTAPAAPSAPTQAPTPAATLPDITTTATRTERRVDAVPGTVSITTAQDAEARSARDLKDLFRYEVDVTVRAANPRFGAAFGSTGRPGNEGINIRGLEGNQVLMVVDGVRVPQAFSFGAFATGRGGYLSLDSLQAAEVLRGPASTQFGSDGLAGALALRTVDPSDLLKPGRSSAAALNLGFNSIDNTRHARLMGAWQLGSVQALLLAATRRSEEVQTQGKNEALDASRTAPNPIDAQQHTLLAKLRWAVLPGQRLGATLEAVQRRVQGDVLSARSVPPLVATSVLRLDAKDRIERRRGSVEWSLDDPNAMWLQQAQARLYLQDAETTQLSLEDRNTAADRVRDNRYRERVAGFTAQATRSFASGTASHKLSAGIDASRTDVSALRDGTVAPFGETFPSRPFPDTEYRLLGAFLQDEVEIGSATLIPAVRLDRYALEPDAAGYTGGAVVSLADSAVTPRLGLVWRASEAAAPYAQWSRGFRAPTPEQVNNGFTNVPSGYRSIGNPNLMPERADSIELGVRGQLGQVGESAGPFGTLRWQVAVYANRYRDFISQEVIGGSFTPADPAIFQYINLAQARIRGSELRLRWALAPGWQINAAAATTRGTSRQNGVSTRLSTVEPAKASLGVGHERGAWAWRADALLVRAKALGDIPAATSAPFAPGSYSTLDLAASFKPTPGLTLHASVANVFDQTYWRWSDARGLASTSTVLDAFTAPGRTWALQARLDF